MMVVMMEETPAGRETGARGRRGEGREEGISSGE